MSSLVMRVSIFMWRANSPLRVRRAFRSFVIALRQASRVTPRFPLLPAGTGAPSPALQSALSCLARANRQPHCLKAYLIQSFRDSLPAAPPIFARARLTPPFPAPSVSARSIAGSCATALAEQVKSGFFRRKTAVLAGSGVPAFRVRARASRADPIAGWTPPGPVAEPPQTTP